MIDKEVTRKKTDKKEGDKDKDKIRETSVAVEQGYMRIGSHIRYMKAIWLFPIKDGCCNAVHAFAVPPARPRLAHT